MGKIFYLMGASSTGKDTIYKKIMKDEFLNLEPIVLYTTRPIRDKEREGVQYHFVDEDKYQRLVAEGVVIESRVYDTIHGEWRYFTVDDGNIDLASNSYLAIGVLQSYISLKEYFGDDKVIPILIEVEEGERLLRALTRERKQENPKYKEMCRRFLSDEEDFSEENISKAGINDSDRYNNANLDECVESILKRIKEKI